MISINGLSKEFGTDLLFDDVTLLLTDRNRYGLVGANGSGKTTLLRMIAGIEKPDDGTISIPKDEKIGILQQDQFLHDEELVIHVVLRGKKKLWSALEEKERLLSHNTNDEKTGYRLAELEEIIGTEDGYAAEAHAQKLLIGLGIQQKYHYGPLKALSGGFKLRVLLAQTLFSEPDILLLDEPTNYLDIVAVAWLEHYLKHDFQGLILFTSHDYDFLNNVSTHILDIDYATITCYTGSYQAFTQEKQNRREQKSHERKHIEQKIAQLRAFINRFKAKASHAKQCSSREKMIAKMEMPDSQQTSRMHPHFNFKQKRPSGKTVLTIKNISKSFADHKVLHAINATIMRGEKIALIGRNGIGKSTLLKILVNQLKPDTGTYEWGHETHVSYCVQDPHELMRHDVTVFEWLSNQVQNEPTATIRTVLGNLLFTQSEVHKKVSCLSGGESTRLLLAKLMLEQPNVLILDEPTNHLDIEAREALAEGLRTYQGTVIFVSHDRHFVSRVATRIIMLTEKGAQDIVDIDYKTIMKYLPTTR